MNAHRSDGGERCQHDLDWESHLLRISITCDMRFITNHPKTRQNMGVTR
jgi:hypothetical protein